MESLKKPLSSVDFSGQALAFASTRLNICDESAESGGSFWTEQPGAKYMVATASAAGIVNRR